MKAVLTALLTCACCAAIAPALARPVSAWKAERNGVEVKVSALQPDQNAAFYQARGFTAETVAPYVAACGFAFELRNTGKSTVRLRLSDWHAAGKGGSARFMLPDVWDAEWTRRGAPESARIAFRWAQFPVEQEFAPGDWIMGMATLDRRLAGPLRLTLRFSNQQQRQHEIAIDNVTCAP